MMKNSLNSQSEEENALCLNVLIVDMSLSVDERPTLF